MYEFIIYRCRFNIVVVEVRVRILVKVPYVFDTMKSINNWYLFADMFDQMLVSHVDLIE